ncbi:STAS domain-containing protein [Herbidospora sp. NEAU-GS84]|uniref:STAS domain-containing protein n=1 Tax=Herbidospora solisilvae TaxID=2696284 RepID=A0A7C9J1B3_9ACTN|nr:MULTISPECIES: STAS domain-containing protein [Herbidospora]NAS21285.1 STAS domain-containing protein [Herbidospora solisilvae]GLX94730.1 polyvinylalcohol dehydrogenase [Herbidospora sp. NBRC 101105]
MTSEPFGDLIDRCRAAEDDLVRRWRADVAASLRGRISELELDKELRELLDAVLSAVATADGADTRSAAYGEVRALLVDLSRARALQGFSPRETAISVFALKRAVRESVEVGPEFTAFSDVIDELGLFTFESYAKTREEVIANQAEQLLELATPVVKLWHGVVALPLVGTLDSARAQVVMEKLLQTLVDTGSEYAIIDITGVPAVDTQVAQHLLKTIVAARLMGAECIISGIRPQIAQTIVALGIEFGDIATKATLADALLLALGRIGVDVTAEMSKRGL